MKLNQTYAVLMAVFCHATLIIAAKISSPFITFSWGYCISAVIVIPVMMIWLGIVLIFAMDNSVRSFVVSSIIIISLSLLHGYLIVMAAWSV